MYWFPGGGVKPTPNGYNTVTIQYWLYYSYDHVKISGSTDWNHEGDWERVSVRFAITDVAAGTLVPISVRFGHHSEGEEQASGRKDWNSSEVLKVDGTHVKAFVTKGGHGNWPTCGKHDRGLLPSDPTAPCDPSDLTKHTAAPGVSFSAYPSYALCNHGGGCDHPHFKLTYVPRRSWACFVGRWGPNTSPVLGRSPKSPMKQQTHFGVNLCNC